MYNKKKLLMFILIFTTIIICFTGCSKKENNDPIDGKYISADGNSYIILTNYKDVKSGKFDEEIGRCNLQFFEIDLSPFSQFTILNGMGNYIMANKFTEISKEESDNIRNMFENKIDLDKQFKENKAEFSYFYSIDEKKHGLCCEIEGSGFNGAYECYVSMEYNLDEKTIICEEIKYILEE